MHILSSEQNSDFTKWCTLKATKQSPSFQVTGQFFASLNFKLKKCFKVVKHDIITCTQLKHVFSVRCPHSWSDAKKWYLLTCENMRFSSLFADGDVSRRGASATQRQKFHTDNVKSVRNPARSSDWSTE